VNKGTKKLEKRKRNQNEIQNGRCSFIRDHFCGFDFLVFHLFILRMHVPKKS